MKIPSPGAKKASAPKQAAQPQAAAANAAMFDQLTDGDFGRQVPFEKQAGSGPDDAATLSRFTHEEAEQKQKAAGVAKGFVTFTAILNILSGIGAIGMIALFAMGAEQLEQSQAYTPARLGQGLGIALFSILALLYIGGAVGLFLKTSWGWLLTAITCDFFIIERLGAIGVLVKEGFEQMAFFAILVPLLGGFFFAMVFFKGDTQAVCGIKSKIPAIIATVIGFALGIGVVVAVFQTLQGASVST